VTYNIHPFRLLKGSRCFSIFNPTAHSFPPDIGQGINAGFADVVQFNNTLSTVNGDLGDVLKEYERVRAPEVSSGTLRHGLLSVS
jgi:2-polyprenyl-6-methoxyphenol hydroxylase and related FAD-dependent oxidoreductases